MINGSRIARSDTLPAKEVREAFSNFIADKLREDQHIRQRADAFEVSQPSPGIVAVRIKPLTASGGPRYFEIKVSEKV